MQILNFAVDLKNSDKLSSLLTLKGKFYTLAIANNPLMILVEILLWQDQNSKYDLYSATKVTKFWKIFFESVSPRELNMKALF